jgi:hypothetical protein
MYFSVAILSKFITFITFIIVFSNIDKTEARIHKMKFVTTCGCAKKIAKERDIAYTKFNELVTISENIITINNCLPGKEFKYEDYKSDKSNKGNKIECKNCPDNYYRTASNSSCLRCPVGYYSNSGDIECTKSETNNTNVHTLCNKGYVSGNNKFAEYEDSCYSCISENKEYMPYKNNHNICFVCPPGSIVDVKAHTCSKCSVGYYEKNNKCIECEIRTYNDKVGANKCNVCNNQNAIAYNSIGGTNCDNSIFYDLTDTIKNNLINMDMILKPIAYNANQGVAIINNNRRAFELLVPSIFIIYIVIIIM